jgi:UDP-galactopyranose mutase
MAKPNLVVFSHLRWSFVYQRPQHLLSRLARHWCVTFIEEPLYREGLPFVEVSHPMDSVRVLVPHTPTTEAGFHEAQFGSLHPLIADWLTQQGIRHPMVWLYTPMALPLAQALDPLCLVYDCMDELGAFKDAPRQLWHLEAALMKQAALVLTGGPSLYEARRRFNPNVHCLPSSVDAAHFSEDRLDDSSQEAKDVRDLQGNLRAPRLGYFGVIDERMDLSLLTLLADVHPDWQIVMVGPVAKIDPDMLPRRPNIHWMGMQAYPRLPYFMAGWDLCLMPFALNESTRFISPTKTLEYMAGNKPVVSSPVNDVVAMYGMAVEIACTPSGFVRACERLLMASEGSREARSSQMASLVAAGSWERTAEKVHTLLCEARCAALSAQPDTTPRRLREAELPFELATGSA